VIGCKSQASIETFLQEGAPKLCRQLQVVCLLMAMTMQSCYQHLLHEQYADKDDACKAVDIGKCHTLVKELLVACTNSDQSTQTHAITLQHLSFDTKYPKHRSRASLVYALIALA